MTRPKVLLVLTVYNGRAFVPRAVESAVRVDRADADIDVLVLDDCSPDRGWSHELAAICAGLGAGYYWTPRNLGIVRNVNLGMLHAVQAGYSHVIICNSDVLFPSNLVSGMLQVAGSDPSIGSVTAWSNNVSAFSLPNTDPDRYLSDQGTVDWISASLAGLYAGSAMDVPAGISFCIMIPTDVVRDVGVMDTVYGRGYCEETDWSLRSLAAGYRITLAPGVFVYHMGRGSTVDAGLVTGGHTTVPENEAVIDLRYPMFRHQVRNFMSSGILEKAHEDAARRLCADAGRQFGYSVEVGWLRRATEDEDLPRVFVSPDGVDPTVRVMFRGFECSIEVGTEAPADAIRAFFGNAPAALTLLDRGAVATALRDSLAADANGRTVWNYPSRV